MKRDQHLLLALVILTAVSLLTVKFTSTREVTGKKIPSFKSLIGTTENPRARMEYEVRKLIDPATKQIPRDIRRLELEYAETLPVADESSLESFTWTHRGPWNVGGRTRALALDIADANEQTILAGGVSGGMWRSTNSGTSWTRTTNASQLQSVTCIAQDTRPGKTNIWYYGTGEFLGNSTSGGDATFKGDGIFKSTNGGLSWSQLPSTVSGTPHLFDRVTDFIYNIAIDPSNQAQDEVYAACYGAVLRSTDGGNTWTTALNGLGTPNQAIATDVAVTSTGVVYATVSNNSSSTKGIYRSTDGVNWTNITPTGFPSNYRRIVIGIAPSNENIVYFLGETPGGGKFNSVDNEWASLWRYDASGGTWVNRSANLPAFGPPVGNFNSQGSYNLIVRVKPDNPNFVIIGATNLYRSTDGFSSNSNTTWIGGYATANDVSRYANHHPDQHSFVFYRNAARSNWALSGHDGGVSLTTGINSPTVSWSSFNNGYLTTQFYTVAIRNASGDLNIIGGKQDNGTYRGVSSSSTAAWQNIFSGDGAFCAISSSGNPYYISAQNGLVYRLTLDANGNYNLSNWTRVDPQGGSGYLFINPFTLDPNNSNLMYFAGGTTLWRNNNLTGIPSLSQNPATFGWTSFNISTFLTPNTVLSAVAVSTTPANRVYVGTADGDIIRVDNAHTASPSFTNVTSLSMPLSYVSCIAIDPTNADNAMVVFSNYNIISLYYTTNGGVSWMPVAGNLEQNPDGTGNGPSCRWAAIRNVPGGKVFLVGTSTGLYVTSTLNGMSTVWQQQAPSTIGRGIVNAIATRESDGLVVVATHGNGVYSGTVNSLVSAPSSVSQPKSFSLSQNYPNPFNPSTTIEYQLPSASAVKLEIFDALGRKITTLVNERQDAGKHQVQFNAAGLASGAYFYKLQAGSNVETRKMLLVK